MTPKRVRSWIQTLSSHCSLSTNQASNELRWMMEGILERRSRPSSRPIDLHGTDLSKTLEFMSLSEQNRLMRWIHERTMDQKPLQYILRSQDFCGLSLRVRPPTLIPRWETEEWTLRLISCIQKDLVVNKAKRLRILDLCTGSGCIALALSHHLKKSNASLDLQVHAMDISSRAIRLAKVNQRTLNIPLETLKIYQGDIFCDADLEGLVKDAGSPFDLVVSNPPYISDPEMRTLDPSVIQWEDSKALRADDNGLDLHRRIIQKAINGLVHTETPMIQTPRMALEFGGSHQVSQLKDIVSPASGSSVKYSKTEFWKDLAGKERLMALYL